MSTPRVYTQADVDKLKDEDGNIIINTKESVVLTGVRTKGSITVESSNIKTGKITSGGSISIIGTDGSQEAKRIIELLKK